MKAVTIALLFIVGILGNVFEKTLHGACYASGGLLVLFYLGLI